MVEHLPAMYKTLGAISSIKKITNQTKENVCQKHLPSFLILTSSLVSCQHKGKSFFFLIFFLGGEKEGACGNDGSDGVGSGKPWSAVKACALAG